MKYFCINCQCKKHIKIFILTSHCREEVSNLGPIRCESGDIPTSLCVALFIIDLKDSPLFNWCFQKYFIIIFYIWYISVYTWILHFLLIKTFIVIVQYNLVTRLSIASYKEFLFSLFHPYLDYVYTCIINLLHDSEEDKIYSPRQNDIFRGQHPKEIWFFLGNKSAYFPNLHAMNCLLYWPTAAYIHVEYTEFKLFFNSCEAKTY